MIGNLPGPAIAGVILAGGRSQRMGGGDKGLLPLGGRPLLAHVVARLAPQVRALAINANGDPGRFAAFGLPVIPDPAGQARRGPLSGILAAMRWAAAACEDAAAVVTVPSDTPFLPEDLVARLAEAGGFTEIAVARSAGRIQPVVGFFPTGHAHELERFLQDGPSLRADAWIARHAVRPVDFAAPDAGAPPPFLNVNTPQDLDLARALLDRSGAIPAAPDAGTIMR